MYYLQLVNDEQIPAERSQVEAFIRIYRDIQHDEDNFGFIETLNITPYTTIIEALKKLSDELSSDISGVDGDQEE